MAAKATRFPRIWEKLGFRPARQGLRSFPTYYANEIIYPSGRIPPHVQHNPYLQESGREHQQVMCRREVILIVKKPLQS